MPDISMCQNKECKFKEDMDKLGNRNSIKLKDMPDIIRT